MGSAPSSEADAKPRIEFSPETDEKVEVWRVVWGDRAWTYWDQEEAVAKFRTVLGMRAAQQERRAGPRARVSRAIRAAGKAFFDETYALSDGDVRVAYALDLGGETNDRLVDKLTDAVMSELRGEV